MSCEHLETMSGYLTPLCPPGCSFTIKFSLRQSASEPARRHRPSDKRTPSLWALSQPDERDTTCLTLQIR